MTRFTNEIRGTVHDNINGYLVNATRHTTREAHHVGIYAQPSIFGVIRDRKSPYDFGLATLHDVRPK